MSVSRYSEAQIIEALKQLEAGHSGERCLTAILSPTRAMRAVAMRKYFSSISIPRNRRPTSNAAAHVDADPQNGSATRSPSREKLLISGINAETGFCVGCNSFLE